MYLLATRGGVVKGYLGPVKGCRCPPFQRLWSPRTERGGSSCELGGRRSLVPVANFRTLIRRAQQKERTCGAMHCVHVLPWHSISTDAAGAVWLARRRRCPAPGRHVCRRRQRGTAHRGLARGPPRGSFPR